MIIHTSITLVSLNLSISCYLIVCLIFMMVLINLIAIKSESTVIACMVILICSIVAIWLIHVVWVLSLVYVVISWVKSKWKSSVHLIINACILVCLAIISVCDKWENIILIIAYQVREILAWVLKILAKIITFLSLVSLVITSTIFYPALPMNWRLRSVSLNVLILKINS